MSSESILGWLVDLPPAALYAALAVAAAVENFFPPFPADTVVAFGSFLAARGSGSATGSFLATWIGNIAGAMGMYALGRRYGAAWFTARYFRRGDAAAARRLRAFHGHRGLWAIAVSRFLPAARALVPPMAGAARVPALRAACAMALASAVWYGTITWLAFRVGSSWDELSRRVAAAGRGMAIAAAVAVVVGGVIWLVRRRRPSPVE